MILNSSEQRKLCFHVRLWIPGCESGVYTDIKVITEEKRKYYYCQVKTDELRRWESFFFFFFSLFVSHIQGTNLFGLRITSSIAFSFLASPTHFLSFSFLTSHSNFGKRVFSFSNISLNRTFSNKNKVGFKALRKINKSVCINKEHKFIYK